jgi:hypothetical protein
VWRGEGILREDFWGVRSQRDCILVSVWGNDLSQVLGVIRKHVLRKIL